MDLDIKGLRVVVTGGALGLGAEIVRRFLAEGARVHACDIDEAALGRLGRQDGLSLGACDVADPQSVERMLAAAVQAMGGLDCLVNNAAVSGPLAPVEETEIAAWEHCLRVCLFGQYYCCRFAVPHLRRSANGSIVNLSSAAGKFGFTNRSAYAAAKSGILGLTRTLSRELGPAGVRCNAVLPGIIDGDRLQRVLAANAQAQGRSPEAVAQDWLAHASIKRMLKAGEVADMIAYLASPRGRSISGQAISIDGDLQMLA
ncbi:MULTISPECIES: SDR family oxidoreductase [Paracoccus]|uniref:SDR family oxidoreductase n=1 Tax=Paracoccus TaxID=265 RepID=UPI000DF77EE6|nr:MULTISPECIES: SDR family oxidoreductase [Paracoccus]MBT0781941.1 SDR family oxidoreductase [Paracoccus sp. pheM1]RDD70503.1 SDR family NAD(P)-dependent oxidoreductase [Paracoccus versutus]